MLTDKEWKRYERQLRLIHVSGQERLKKAEIFLGGAGGLGSVVSLYLAAAGVGRLRIADSDSVDCSNLNRQILHRTSDLGRKKVASAEEKLIALNPEIRVEAISENIDSETVQDLVGNADLIIDALDNYPARYLLNRTAMQKGIPFIHGAVQGFDGQATTILPEKTACLRCFLPWAPPPTPVSVLGVTCGVIGSIQATEAVKCILGSGELLENRLLIWDGKRGRMDEIPLERNPNCMDCGGAEDAPQI